MLTLSTSTLEKGIIKATANAKDLIETAITLKSLDNISNKSGYSVLFMQTGLEEAAKASFLFEKYIGSLQRGHISIDGPEWQLWMGGRHAHSKRVARVQYLYALSEQEGSMPVAAIMFPQGVKEMLQNRNAALYVDFDQIKHQFVSPTEVVDPNFLIANSSFARQMLHYTCYDKAIESLKAATSNSPGRFNWLMKSIELEQKRKRKEVLRHVDTYKKETSVKSDYFNKEVETIFCAMPRPNNEFGLLYACVVGTPENEMFIMDDHPNHFAIHPDGKIVHAMYARTSKVPIGFQHDWEIIGVR